jgi:hypothetical protein
LLLEEIASFLAPKRVESPAQQDPQFWQKVHSLSLRYLFYYEYDYGLSPHEHDLEVAEFHVLLETSEQGCYQVRVDRVIGLAHGVDWYSKCWKWKRTPAPRDCAIHSFYSVGRDRFFHCGAGISHTSSRSPNHP